MVSHDLTKKEQAQVTRRNADTDRYVNHAPAADIWETEDAIFIRVDMPGVAGDDVEVKVERDML